MKFLNVCTKQTYEKNGETKTVWLNCGTVRILDDGKKFLQLNILPDTTFYLFEPKPKEEQTKLPEDW